MFPGSRAQKEALTYMFSLSLSLKQHHDTVFAKTWFSSFCIIFFLFFVCVCVYRGTSSYSSHCWVPSGWLIEVRDLGLHLKISWNFSLEKKIPNLQIFRFHFLVMNSWFNLWCNSQVFIFLAHKQITWKSTF